MKKVLNLTVFTLFAAILAFSGCEAGLSNSSSNSSTDDSDFSFSEMYKSISNLQQDNIAIRAELAAMTGGVATDTASLTAKITLLETENAALKTSKAPVESTVPVGAIVAWHKSLSGIPALAANFVECNGSVISDAESPLNGQILPNLNYANGRFLRGGSFSGDLQNDQIQEHTHNIPVWFRAGQTIFSQDNNFHSWGWQTGGDNNDTRPSNGVTGARVATGTEIDETRPTNMSVVWVMRIK
ncbi:MAG: hypothetical protein GY754_43930 [bacterium]|nr:hypothetical protein [bacterium]